MRRELKEMLKGLQTGEATPHEVAQVLLDYLPPSELEIQRKDNGYGGQDYVVCYDEAKHDPNLGTEDEGVLYRAVSRFNAQEKHKAENHIELYALARAVAEWVAKFTKPTPDESRASKRADRKEWAAAIRNELKDRGIDVDEISPYGIGNWRVGLWRADGLTALEIADKIEKIIKRDYR